MTENQTQSKRYTLTGVVASMIVREDRNGNPWVAFDLIRSEKTKIKCVAFTDKAGKFLARFRDGSEVKVYGYFETRTFTGQDGQTRSFQQFKLLWSDRADGETAQAA